MANVDLQATLRHLQSTATEQVAQWPQYNGHFTGYKLVRLKCDVKTKTGLAFTQGEYAIATQKQDTAFTALPSSGKFVTVWSRRNKVDTSVRLTDHNARLTKAQTLSLFARIRELEDALTEACNWADCESGEGIHEQRAAVARLRTLVQDPPYGDDSA